MTTTVTLVGTPDPDPRPWATAAPPDAAARVDTIPRPAADPGGAWVAPAADHAPVIAPWLRHRDQRRSAAGWWCGHVGHLLAFHSVRLPLYCCRVARRSPWGLAVIVAAWWRWVRDDLTRAERQALAEAVRADSRGAPQLDHAADRHRRSIRVRLAVTVAAVAAVPVAAAWAMVTAASRVEGAATAALGVSAPAQVVARGSGLAAVAVLAVAALVALGLVGRPQGRRLTDWAVSRDDGPPRLTLTFIRSALLASNVKGLAAAVKADEHALRFLSDPTRSGAGWRVDIELPAGIVAASVVERRDALASALRRHRSQVWPAPDPDAHEGRLTLFVGDRPMAEQPPTPWPLLTQGKVDLFDAQPIGVDEQGRPVTLLLMFSAGVIGAIPRMGKTFCLRVLALIAGLDPRCRVFLFDLKGGVDLKPCAAFAEVYTAGDQEEQIKLALATLRKLQAEMSARYTAIRELPVDICPEGKVTTELASDRSLSFEPIFLGVDECQIWFEHDDHGKEFEALTTDLVKRGPAVGIMVWPATQRPDSKALPVGIRDNAGARVALKVTDPVPNNMILGAGAYAQGYQATAFSRRDVGVSWVVGARPDPTIVRWAYVDAPAATAVAARARAARERAGRLTGMAAGIVPDLGPQAADARGNILVDLVGGTVWPAGQDKVTLEDLADRLAAAHPDRYRGMDARALGVAVRAAASALGGTVATVNVAVTGPDGKARRPKGLDRDTVADLAADALTVAADRAEGLRPPTAAQADDDQADTIDPAAADHWRTASDDDDPALAPPAGYPRPADE